VQESELALKRRARRMNRELASIHPDAHCELDFETPFQLLIATVLSAQTTDVRVNLTTPTLFAKYPTPHDLAAANPEALVLLSTRSSAEEWWNSVSKTLFAVLDRDLPPDLLPMRAMNEAMFERFTPHWRDRDAAMAAYDAHNTAVRAAVPGDRLIDWQPRDGWEPICSALGIPVPDIAFPHANTSDDFQKSADERLNR